MSRFEKRAAVVTGAGSGIGRALALELARRGADLALTDIDETTLAATAATATTLGASVVTEAFDVADAAAWASYADKVTAQFDTVHHVYNCAGIAAIAPLTEITHELFQRTLDVNLGGVVNGTKTFLPHLIASGEGVVVNIASIEGLIGYANLTAYCTSKFAVRGFTEAVRVEMLAGRHPVSVHLVLPGSVKTPIFDNARTATPPAPAAVPATKASSKLVSQEDAATAILDGVARKKARILIARDTPLVDRLVRLLPTTYPRVIAAVQRRGLA